MSCQSVIMVFSWAMDRSWRTCLTYSYLNATSGSTFVARLAGTQHATNAVSVNTTTTPAKIVVSVGVTPNNNPRINRVKANAAARPITSPISANNRSEEHTSELQPRGL